MISVYDYQAIGSISVVYVHCILQGHYFIFYFDQKSPFNINFSETTVGNVIKSAFGLSIVVLNQHVYCAALKVEILTRSSMGCQINTQFAYL